MKFGKQIKRLADREHLNHYLAYDVLKKAINVVFEADQEGEADIVEAFGNSPKGGTSQPKDSRFRGLLDHQLTKVNLFFALQLRTLLDKLRECQRALRNYSPGPAGDELLSTAARYLEEAAEELVNLENFRRLNFTGFRKIAKKFDKQWSQAKKVGGQASLSSWFVPSLLRQFFVAAPLDAHILALALGWSAIRRYRSDGEEPVLASPPPAPPGAAGVTPTTSTISTTSATSTTTTFWLMPAARMQALCTLVKRFELVVPPSAGAWGGEAASGCTNAAKGDSLVGELNRVLRAMGTEGTGQAPCRIATATSLVYFDAPSDQYPAYHTRLQNSSEGAGPPGTTFRCRRSGADDSELVERSGACSALGVHAFTPIAVPQSPEAFPLQLGTASAGLSAASLLSAAAAAQSAASSSEYLSALGSQGCSELASFAKEVASVASNPSLSAVATVGMARMLLRGDTDSTRGVTIALDEDVQFSLGRPAGPAVAAPSDAIDFPYCLLEVAGEENGSTAKWLEELRADAALRGVPGFSVGAHAIAALHKESLSELPHWYQHVSNVENHAPAEAWGVTFQWREAVKEAAQEDEATQTVASAAAKEVTAGLAVLPPLAGQVVAVDTAAAASATEDWSQLEPKNFLASERTMLEWMHTVLALAFVGIGLWRYSLEGRQEKIGKTSGLLNTRTTSRMALGIYSLVLIVTAVVFAWYAVFSHLARLKGLFKGEHTERTFNRRLYPVIFGTTVGLALVAHLCVQVIPLFSEVDGPGDQ
eukprot:CAMPEP_0115085738 /NCGR_PEP_ID=MMETSP0227-20121206/22133_1 /TAXON_ID=89957 /ORGANISM="Polarella glacialis, Strain CCMP 1383" /LENGTH=762 /DNA_ID=CAMNT_0002474991 /DNA_START=110 /DNA_END=2398 /DNA_ORIENTATION=+